MCRTTSCRRCGKTTWTGCGSHADQVMRSVPGGQRCTCTSADDRRSSNPNSSLLGRLIGR